ncbi:hypothetical protein ABZZ79_34080 [Streptomyces sp. NPDC006458]|uniref:hypothetical protein n=1 Tax=Streptomyces sp. NPDC006458 TaxID=3154302 RepID=UPI0033BEA498
MNAEPENRMPHGQGIAPRDEPVPPPSGEAVVIHHEEHVGERPRDGSRFASGGRILEGPAVRPTREV